MMPKSLSISLTVSEERGLVQNEHVERAMGARPGDHQQLLVGDGELARLLIRPPVNAEPTKLLLRVRLQAATVEDAAAEPRLLERHEQVLGDGQMRKQAQFLGHVADALEELRLVVDALFEDAHLALVRQLGAGQHLDEGRLARAVLAGDDVNRAGAHGDRHVRERHDPRVAACHASRLNQIFCRHRPFHPTAGCAAAGPGCRASALSAERLPDGPW